MARHGGGSRSGGRSSSSSGGHRSGSGSNARTSSTPFIGCYNRSYVNRRGVRVDCYTSDKNFGTRSGWNAGKIFALIFITFHMIMMVGGFATRTIHIGGKVDGNPDRIEIIDSENLLSRKEEKELLDFFEEIYDITGMPITLYTDDFKWKKYYHGNDELTAIQVYSEELYYSMGTDEDSMLFLFTIDEVDGFTDWEYDVCSGDNTVKCISDDSYEQLLDSFHKAIKSKSLCDAIQYAFNEIKPDMTKSSIDTSEAFVVPMFIIVYSIFYVSIIGNSFKVQEAYKYFKEHPETLEMDKMIIYNTCPHCGAPNSNGDTTCNYCGALLKVSNENTKYINP